MGYEPTTSAYKADALSTELLRQLSWLFIACKPLQDQNGTYDMDMNMGYHPPYTHNKPHIPHTTAPCSLPPPPPPDPCGILEDVSIRNPQLYLVVSCSARESGECTSTTPAQMRAAFRRAPVGSGTGNTEYIYKQIYKFQGFIQDFFRGEIAYMTYDLHIGSSRGSFSAH